MINSWKGNFFFFLVGILPCIQTQNIDTYNSTLLQNFYLN